MKKVIGVVAAVLLVGSLWWFNQENNLEGTQNKEGFSVKEVEESKGQNLEEEMDENQIQKDMTIFLSVPSIEDEYYAEVFDDIIDFHVRYSKVLQEAGEKVVVLADEETFGVIKDDFSDGVLQESTTADIWMRDFTTVNPYNPIQFRYEGKYFDDPEEPRFIKRSFNRSNQARKVNFRKSDFILDGGNVVDNYNGSLVVSKRFLEENNITTRQGQDILKKEYGAEYVAIIPYDDEVMGHADGMVMFVDNVLFVNKYEEPFRSSVLDILKHDLPQNIKIVEVDVEFEQKSWKDFSSSCGIHINSLVTNKNIFVPSFGDKESTDTFVNTLRQYTDKLIYTIDAQNVCFMGGSVRCLSWQVAQ